MKKRKSITRGSLTFEQVCYDRGPGRLAGRDDGGAALLRGGGKRGRGQIKLFHHTRWKGHGKPSKKKKLKGECGVGPSKKKTVILIGGYLQGGISNDRYFFSRDIKRLNLLKGGGKKAFWKGLQFQPRKKRVTGREKGSLGPDGSMLFIKRQQKGVVILPTRARVFWQLVVYAEKQREKW